MKKRFLTFMLIIFSLFLVSCDDKVISFSVADPEGIPIVLNEGEKIDYSKLQLTLTYGSNKLKMMQSAKDISRINHNYNSNPVFNHLDPDDNEREQEVIFTFRKLKTEPVTITTKRHEVERVVITRIGKSEYQYGDALDLSDFSVFIDFKDKPNEQIPLSLDMLSLEYQDGLILPDELGDQFIDVYYNGVQASAPIVIRVTKATQTLSVEDVLIERFDDYNISVREIEGAEYAFYPKGTNVNTIEWQESNNFESDEIITEDYDVYVRLSETEFYESSNVVNRVATYIPNTANLIVKEIFETKITFEYVEGFRLEIIDDSYKIIQIGRIEVIDDEYVVSGLKPNHNYRFALVKEGLTIVYPQNVLQDKVKTKELFDFIDYDEDQSGVYNKEEHNFTYTVDPIVSVTGPIINVKYYQDDLEVDNPFNAGVYEVRITTDYNDEVLYGEFVVNKRALVITIKDKEKDYYDDDPENEVTFGGTLLDDKNEFEIDFFREEGEKVQDYIIDATITHDNYDIEVVKGVLKINKKQVSAKIDKRTIIYGDELNDVTYTFNNEINFFDGHEDAFDFNYQRKSTNKNVGEYNKDLYGTLTNPYYSVTLLDGDLEIVRREITLTIHDKEMVYGNNRPDFTYGLSEESFRAELNIRLKKEDSSNYKVGDYKVSIDTINDSNFVVSVSDGNYKVTPRPIEIKIRDLTFIYGQKIDDFSAQVGWSLKAGYEFASGDSNTSFATEYLLSFTDVLDAGEHVLSANISNPNYEIIEIEAGIVSINRKDVYVDPTDGTYTKVYGDSDPEFTYTTSDGVKLEGSLEKEIETEDVGIYNIVAGSINNEMNPNYNIIYNQNGATVRLRIIAAVLTITADEISQIYGENEKPLTYSVSGLKNSDKLEDVISGSLERAVGKNVGSYNINRGSLATISTNYTISFVTNKYNITPKELFVVADNKAKTYGDDDPTLTYKATGFAYEENGNTPNLFSGLLSRVDGKDVGEYTIIQGSLSAGNNYTITYTPATLTINKRNLTLTVEDASKVYGQEDLDFEYELSEEAYRNELDIVLTREAGIDVGTYTITLASYNDSNIKIISTINGIFTITPKELKVTANDKVKTYGDNDPLLTYTATGFEFNDEESPNLFTGSLSRVDGKDVGEYTIIQGSLNAGNNYTITYTPATLTINKRSLTITIEDQTRIYGQDDLDFEYELSEEEYDDELNIVLIREVGIDVDTYAITLQSYEAQNINLEVIKVGTFTVNKKPLTVTYSKEGTFVYGEQYSINASSSDLVYGNQIVVNQSLVDFAGSHSVDIYIIDSENKDVSNNYAINNNSYNFEVNKRKVTFKVNEDSKVYGEVIDNYGYTITSEYEPVDAYSVEFTLHNENVGSQELTLVATIDNSENYELDYINSVVNITKATLTITPDNNLEKTYGDEEEALTYMASGFKRGETISILNGKLDRAMGENVGEYLIGLGSLSAGNNYELVITEEYFTISKRSLTLTIKDQTRIYGQDDLVYEYELSEETYRNELDIVLTREVGIDVGTYAITRQSYNSQNINLEVIRDGIFTITTKELIVVAINKAKTYGDNDPLLTYTATGFGWNDEYNPNLFTGSLSREDGKDVGSYIINQGTLSAGANYTITYTPATLTINKRSLTLTIEDQTRVYGQNDLVYEYELSEEAYRNELDVVLSREEGIDVGTYAITRQSYNSQNINLVVLREGTFRVTPKELKVFAEEQVKTYGDDDPLLTYTATGFEWNDEYNPNLFTGSLSREEGKDVGSYIINQGTLSAGSNYTITYTQADLVISKLNLTLTIDDKEKVYGEVDPSFTYSLNNEDYRDELNIKLTRTSGENVRQENYVITLDTYNENNITLTTVMGTLTIKQKDLEILYQVPENIVYGSSYIIRGFAELEYSDTLVLSNIDKVNVGNYDINYDVIDSNGVSALYNYNVISNKASYAITKANLTIIAGAQTYEYGIGLSDVDLEDYQVLGLKRGDKASAVLSGELGITNFSENVGTYTISKGSLEANDNYNLIFIENYLIIEQREIILTYSNNKTLTYGQEANVIINTIHNSLVAGHYFKQIGLNKNAGAHIVSVKVYDSNDNDVTDNYLIYNDKFTYQILKKELIVYIGNNNRTYGEDNSTINYSSHIEGFVNGEDSRVLGYLGENGLVYNTTATIDSPKGEYMIYIEEGYTADNYKFTYVNGILTINPASLILEIDEEHRTFIYDGEIKSVDPNNIILKDPTTLLPVNVDYELVYISQGLEVTPKGAGSYIIRIIFNGNEMYEETILERVLTINKRNLTLTIEDQTRVYGQDDLVYEYELSEETYRNELDVVLTREAGIDVGTYAITRQSYNSQNINLEVIRDGTFTITPKELIVAAIDKAKTYGDNDPELTYEVSGFEHGETRSIMSGLLSRESGEDVGSYTITIGTLSAGANYTITYTPATLLINKRNLTLTIGDQTRVYGQNDLDYEYELSEETYRNELDVVLTREEGIDVGTYAITRQSYNSQNINLEVIRVGTFRVTPKELIITADDKTKTYGNDDPALTYKATGFGWDDEYNPNLFTGSLSRVSGEYVKDGGYAINQNTLSAGPNYTITYIPSILTIEKRDITITYTGLDTIYNGSEQEVMASSEDLAFNDKIKLTGHKQTVVGNYVVQVDIVDGNSISVLNNYNIDTTTVDYVIHKRNLTLTIEDQTRVYGQDDLDFEYELSEETYRNELDVVLTREAGIDVGAYAITRQSYNNQNINLEVIRVGTFRVTPKELIVAAIDKAKTYGDNDPELTYEVSGFEHGETRSIMSGLLSRESGEDVGSYTITIGTLSAGTNYTIAYTSDVLLINKRNLTITIDNQTKVYGEDDPDFTYTLSDEDYRGELDIELIRNNDSRNVGSYEITLKDYNNQNIIITSVDNGALTITPKELIVTAGAKEKVYGEADPSFTYEVSGFAYQDDADNDELFTGTLSRVSGEDVIANGYAITKGSLSAGDNYSITLISADLTIEKRPITITYIPPTPKMGRGFMPFGINDIVLETTYNGSEQEVTTFSEDLAFSDKISLSGHKQTLAAEYIIQVDIISDDSHSVLDNYDIETTTVTYIIHKLELTLSIDNVSKVYGAVDPLFTYVLSDEDYRNELDIELVREIGENVRAENYVITLAEDGYNNQNIIISDVTNGVFTITPKELKVTADNMTKTYGDVEPILTYTATGFEWDDENTPNLFTGTLSRVDGKNVGEYTINQGSLSAGTNYTITYTPATFTISKRNITITIDDQTKVYGEDDPGFTYTLSEETYRNELGVVLTRVEGKDVNANGYAITLHSYIGQNINLTTEVNGLLTITPRDLIINAVAKSKVYGEADPLLTYIATNFGHEDNEDILSGSLVRVSGQNVGTYAINQGSVVANANYTIIYTPAELTITTKELKITADDKAKTYKDSDPTLTYKVEGLVSGDSITGSLSRVGGENVGTYEITIGTVSAGSNYTITYTSDVLRINKRNLTITIDNQEKVYGEDDPDFTYTLSEEAYRNELGVNLTRDSIENVGNHTITVGSYNTDNLTINIINSGTLTITQKDLEIEYGGLRATYDGIEKTVTTSNLAADLAFDDEIVLSNHKHTNGGTYIVVSSVYNSNGDDVTANYNIINPTAELIINKLGISVVWDFRAETGEVGAIAKHGNYELELLLNNHNNQNIGTHIATASLVKAIDIQNYNLVNTSREYTISKKYINIDTPEKTLTYNSNIQNYVMSFNDDNKYVISDIKYKKDDVETQPINVGRYEVTFKVAGSDPEEYYELFVTTYLNITARVLTITPDSGQTKVYGDSDPTYTYTYSNLASNDDSSVLSGPLSRVSGKNVGQYSITLGELTVNSNYTINFVNDIKFTITKRTLNVSVAGAYVYNGQEQTINLNDNKLSGDDLTLTVPKVTNAGSHTLKITPTGADKDNYTIPEEIMVNVAKADVVIVGTHTAINEKQVFEKDYTDNSVKAADPKIFDIKIGGVDLSSQFTYVYKINGNTITNLDLSNGGTTFVIEVTATNTSGNMNNFTQTLIYKYKSVTVGNNTTYYTIEDALEKSKSGDTVIVKYNTSFADKATAETVYNTSTFEVRSGVTLLLPYDADYKTGLEEADNATTAINKTAPFVNLSLSSELTLNIKGTLTVNAKRGNASTVFMGFILGNNYAIFEIENNSSLVVQSGGTLNAIGIITGKGEIIAESGSNILEAMFIKSFRGGTATTGVQSYVFPFNQYTLNNIESNFRIYAGANYKALALLYMSKDYFPGIIPIVSTSGALISLTEGYAEKQYNSGKVSIILAGKAVLGDVSIKISSVNVSSSGKDMPFDGTWEFIIKDGSELTVNSSVALLPGAAMNIESGGKVIINKNAKIIVYNPYEVIHDHTDYPNDATKYYRTTYGLNFKKSTPAHLIVDGILDVNGTLVGRVDSTNGTVNFLSGHIKETTVKYVYGSASSAVVYGMNFKYWSQDDVIFSAHAKEPANKKEAKEITIVLKDKNGVPLEGAIVNHSIVSGSGAWANIPIVIGADGTAKVTYTPANTSTTKVKFSYTDSSNKVYEVTFEFKASESSPFLYGEDENGNLHFEHEPISISMIKTVEGTSFGTLRLLRDQNGVYYIQVIEEGGSITVLNGTNLYAIDYENNAEIIDAFFDVYGKPHTIKERIEPITFVDQYGNSHLDAILNKDEGYAIIDAMSNELMSYFIATFERTNDNRYAKLMISAREMGNTMDVLLPVLATFNAHDNLWWLDQAFLNDPQNKLALQNVFDSIKMKIQIWNGSEWVTQAIIEPGTYLTEEFLIELDLQGINTNQIQVRILFPTEIAYGVDYVAIDFSENVEMTVHKLDLVSAILNGTIDVYDAVINSKDNKYVDLHYQDGVRFGFVAPALQDGYTRFFGVSMSGYIYAEGAKVSDELVSEMEGKTFEEIKQIIIDSGNEDWINYIPAVEEVYYFLTTIGHLDQEEILTILFEFIDSTST